MTTLIVLIAGARLAPSSCDRSAPPLALVREPAHYKGGSEPGVLNLSTWAEKAGKKHCVVTTWNDPKKDVEKSMLVSLHGALLAGLR